MAPIRRYLRITKFSVLETRIYLDQPGLVSAWLLNPRQPVLPRVIEAIRPLVIPKLREEQERQQAKRKGKEKKRGVKDVVVQDDFEVVIFLTETTNRHSIMYKHKHFQDTGAKPLKSNSSKLTGGSNDAPIDVEAQREDSPVAVLQEDDASSEDGFDPLRDLPEASTSGQARGEKRVRETVDLMASEDDDDDDEDDLFGSEEDEGRARKRAKNLPGEELGTDDKKKLAMDTTYDGFAIYGAILCLIVKKRDKAKGKEVAGNNAMMEDWIANTQVPAGVDIEDD